MVIRYPVVFFLLLSVSVLSAKPIQVSQKPLQAKNYAAADGKLVVFHSPEENYGVLGVFHSETRLMVVFQVSAYNQLQNGITGYLDRPFEVGETTLFQGPVRVKHTIKGQKPLAFEKMMVVVKAIDATVATDGNITEEDGDLNVNRRTIQFHFFDMSSGKPRGVEKLTISLDAISGEGEDLSEAIRLAFVTIEG